MLNAPPVLNRLRTGTQERPPADSRLLYITGFTRSRTATVRTDLPDVFGLVPIHQQPIDAVRV